MDIVELANRLDAQLAILAIEGLSSEHEIYEYKETETDIKDCPQCKARGIIEYSYIIHDFDSDGWLPDLYDFDEAGGLLGIEMIDCPMCDGEGELYEEKQTTYRDSWTTSNIFI